jgi:protein phosphatase
MEKQVPQEPSLRVGLKSSAGPRELNEDSAFIQDYTADVALHRYLCLGAVADGMGGHKAGEEASNAAIQLLFREFNAQRTGPGNDPDASAEDLLFDLFSAINATVYDTTLRNEELQGMGTTLTAFLAQEGRAFIAHVGDSRAYLVRDASITQLTEDHTLVENMVRDNVITREQAATHSDRHVITRAIGVEQSVAIDLLSFGITPGDIIMLCTDGLYDVVNPQEFPVVINGSTSLQSACEELVRLAIDGNTTDNVTVLLWMVPEPSQISGAIEPTTAGANEPLPPSERTHVPPSEKRTQGGRINKTTLAVIFTVVTIAGFILGWLIAAWI